MLFLLFKSIIIIIIIISYSLFTGFSWYFSTWNQWWTPQLRLQVSDCSTFLIMCDAPSIAIFCRESIECFPGIVSRYFLSSLVTISVALMISDMTKQFMFHMRWISILKLLYFNLFSDSFCITFLSDGIATSISKQTLSFLFFIIMSGLFTRTSLLVCTTLLHSTVISSCWHAGLGMWEYQFSVVSVHNVLHIE
jgi:hypothetical protein